MEGKNEEKGKMNKEAQKEQSQIWKSEMEGESGRVGKNFQRACLDRSSSSALCEQNFRGLL